MSAAALVAVAAAIFRYTIHVAVLVSAFVVGCQLIKLAADWYAQVARLENIIKKLRVGEGDTQETVSSLGSQLADANQKTSAAESEIATMQQQNLAQQEQIERLSGLLASTESGNKLHQ